MPISGAVRFPGQPVADVEVRPLCVGIARVCVYRPISGGVCTMDSSRQTTTKTASPAATNIFGSQPLLFAKQFNCRRQNLVGEAILPAAGFEPANSRMGRARLGKAALAG